MKKETTKYLAMTIYFVSGALIFFIIVWTFLNFKIIWGYLANLLKLLWLLFKPLVVGFVIAYLLEPIVEFYLHKCALKETSRFYKWSRAIATALTFVTIICFIGLFVLVVTMNVKSVIGTGSWTNLRDSIDYYMIYFQRMLDQFLITIGQFVPTHAIQGAFDYFYSQVAISSGEVSVSVVSSVKSIASNTLSVGLGIVIAFYFLKDKESLLKIWNNILARLTTRRIGREIHAIAHDVDYVFSGYIRGQLIDAAIMGGLTSLALTLIGLDFAIIIGIISGLFNIIPYFGPFVGLILAGIIGFVGGEPTKAIIAMVAVFILQQIDGWFIVPKVIGESVKLHPIVVLMAIIIGGELWGIAGILLGIPIAAFIRCLIVRYIGDIF